MEAAREQKAETLQDRIEVNKLDITLPQGDLHAATKMQESKGWKARQEKLSAGRSRVGPKGIGTRGMIYENRAHTASACIGDRTKTFSVDGLGQFGHYVPNGGSRAR